MKTRAAFVISMMLLVLWLIPGGVAFSEATETGRVQTEGITQKDLNDDGAWANAVIYFNVQTNDQGELTTARLIAETIKARWSGQEFWIARIKDNRIINREIGNDDNAAVVSGKATGEETLQGRIFQDLESKKYHLWLIVPENAENAADKFWENTPLGDQLMSLSSGKEMRIHVICIGENAGKPSGKTPYDEMLLSDTGAMDWICIEKQFLATAPNSPVERKAHNGVFLIAKFLATASNSPVERKAHNGVFLIANMYGTSVDIPVETGNVFHMPEKGKVLVLAQLDPKKDGEVRVSETDQNGEFIESPNGEPIEIKDGRKVLFRGSCIEELAEGDYSIQAPENAALFVYYYPNLDRIAPSFSVVEAKGGIIYRGEKELQITLTDDLGRPTLFQPSFRCLLKNENGEKVEKELDPVVYDEDTKSWKTTLRLVESDKGSIVLTPELALYQTDGNLVWKWTGEEKEYQIQTKSVDIKTNAPTELNLYYDENNSGSIHHQWAAFFDYNTFDDIRPEIVNENAAKSSGYEIREADENGFTISIRIPNDRDETKLEDFVLKLRCDSKEHELTIHPIKLKELNDQIVIETEQGGKTAGTELIFTAKIPSETLDAYSEAKKQNEGFVTPSEMEFVVRWGGQEEIKPFEDGKAVASFTIPSTQSAGETKAEAIVRGKEQTEEAVKTQPLTVQILNESPFLKGELPKPISLFLGGTPAEWGHIGLLKTVLGPAEEKNILKETWLKGEKEDKLFSLFEDDTGVSSIMLTVEPADQLILPDGDNTGYNALADGQSTLDGENTDNKWSVRVNKEDPLPQIMLQPHTGTVKYIVALQANDGAYDSEPVKAEITVESSAVKTIRWIVIGIGAALLILIAALIIRQVRKPSFDNVNIRCLTTTENDEYNIREMMKKTPAVSLQQFGKKAAPLSTVLILAHQPPMNQENTAIVNDISLLPSRYDIKIAFGTKALEILGNHEKKELIVEGSVYHLKLGNTYVYILKM